MRAQDLKRAQALVSQRDSALDIARRIGAGERLHFILGEGPGASEIVVSDAYGREVAQALAHALSQRAEHMADELKGLGVDG